MKKILILIICFVSTISFCQTLNDSTAYNTSIPLYSRDGTLIGIDSIFRIHKIYDFDGYESHTYDDTLIMRISYINTTAYVSKVNDENPALTGTSSCAEECSFFILNFNNYYSRGCVNGNTYGIDIGCSGWYEIEFGATIYNGNGYNSVTYLGLNISGSSFIDNTKIGANVEDGKTLTMSSKRVIYLNSGESLKLAAETVSDYYYSNYFLSAKLKL